MADRQAAAHEFFGNLLHSGAPLQTAVQASFSSYMVNQLSPAQRLAFETPASADATAIVEEVFGSDIEEIEDQRRSAALDALLDPNPGNRVKTIPDVISTADCMALREYCDQALAERGSLEGSRDNVDGLPDFQINISVSEMRILLHHVGERVSRLVCDLDQVAFGKSCRGPPGIFLRRYTANSRPWMPFHTDSNAVRHFPPPPV